MAQSDPYSETDNGDILDEFLGDTTRASEWRALREALRGRLRAMLRARDTETDPAALPALETQIAALRKQVAALETEEVVAKFVEDSIKVSLARTPAHGEIEGE
jgi:hypothetical protein